MPPAHFIIPSAGLQAFEQGSSAFNPAAKLSSWQEQPSERIEMHEDSWSMPHEIAYARAGGLRSDEGLIPWAAYETQTYLQPCAWVHPCRLDVGMTDMVMQPTHRLQLTDPESRELHAVIAPYFEQDGITLRYHSAAKWLAVGEQFAEFKCASLARVQGRSINEFLPDLGEFPLQLSMSRLQAEVQMLLYTHPLTEARLARGLPAVNSFWVDGAGQLAAMPATSSEVKLDTRLAEAAHSEAAYNAAWADLLADATQQAAQALASGADVSITLCGETTAITLRAAQPSWKQKITRFLQRTPKQNLREAL